MFILKNLMWPSMLICASLTFFGKGPAQAAKCVCGFELIYNYNPGLKGCMMLAQEFPSGSECDSACYHYSSTFTNVWKNTMHWSAADKGVDPTATCNAWCASNCKWLVEGT